MRMRVCYLYCHEGGLCCYLVKHIENLLLRLQLFYFHLWPIYWPRIGFEPLILVLELAKISRGLRRVATTIGICVQRNIYFNLSIFISFHVEQVGTEVTP
jgi:hypothetical protein